MPIFIAKPGICLSVFRLLFAASPCLHALLPAHRLLTAHCSLLTVFLLFAASFAASPCLHALLPAHRLLTAHCSLLTAHCFSAFCRFYCRFYYRFYCRLAAQNPFVY
jgi:hypothetical protein